MTKTGMLSIIIFIIGFFRSSCRPILREVLAMQVSVGEDILNWSPRIFAANSIVAQFRFPRFPRSSKHQVEFDSVLSPKIRARLHAEPTIMMIDVWSGEKVWVDI